MLTSARPASLRRVAVVGRDVSADVQRCGHRLSAVLREIGGRRSAGMPPWCRSLGDDLLRLESSWSVVEAWVGRVGEAFDRADSGQIGQVGPPAPSRMVSVPEAVLGVTGEGPTWVDALTDAQSEAEALRLAALLRPVADRLAGADRDRVRAHVWPLVRRLRGRWPAAVISVPRPSSASSPSACATPPPRPPDGLEDALELLHLAGPGRGPHTAGVVEGALAGFFSGEAATPYDNFGGEVARTAGHVASGVLLFGDVRDALVEGSRGNWPGFGLAAGGLVPGAGDFLKGGKAIDDVVEARRVAANFRVDLSLHEGRDLGHTISKHVGQTLLDMDGRLAQQSSLSSVSTFATTAEAEVAVSAVLRRRRSEIEAWLDNSSGSRPKSFEVDLRRRTGALLERGASEARSVSGARVVLIRDDSYPDGFRILTAFPTP